MPDVIDPIPIELDRLRYLYFTKRAVRTSELELSKLWGKPRTFFQAIMDLIMSEGQVSVVDLTVLLWQGLLRDDPTLRLEDMDELLPVFDQIAMAQIAMQVLAAWQAQTPALPANETQEEKDADPLAPSTGPATLPLPVSISG